MLVKDEEFIKRQSKTPYFEVLKRYVDNNVLTFHCPGHQGGKGAIAAFFEFLGRNAFAADITQVFGMDDIHQPKTIVKEAQKLAAEIYEADASFFLINGSSSGNQAMIMSVCKPNEKLILPRNSHKSATAAMILSGAVPAYMIPEFDNEMHVDHTVSPVEVERALNEHSDAKAVMLISPTYYGATSDLKTNIEIIHKHGKIAMVDEAWGPHLGFHKDLPMSAMQAGADICINSTHKLISGFSQASMLHVKGDKVDRGRLQSALRIFLSTSPNSILIASLDTARMQMALEGEEILDRTIKITNLARERINSIKGMKTFGPEMIGKPGVSGYDLTRLVFSATDLGLTGYALERELRTKYNIQIELADLFNCIALVTIGNYIEDIDKLTSALKEISDNADNAGYTKSEMFEKFKNKTIDLPEFPPMMIRPREAFFADYETVEFRKASARICTEVITPYPPGIPIICPGEEITQEIIDYLEIEIKEGMHIQGPVDPELNTIRVVKE